MMIKLNTMFPVDIKCYHCGYVFREIKNIYDPETREMARRVANGGEWKYKSAIVYKCKKCPKEWIKLDY